MIKKLKFFIKKLYLKYKFGINLDLTTNIRSDIKLEEKVNIGKYCNINCKSIGKYTFIGDFTRIDSHTESIGRFCSIATGVKIGVGIHPDFFISSHAFCYDPKYGFINTLKFDEYNYKKSPTIIGNDVLISTNVIILSGVKIGDGSIIGAGAVVTKDVPSYSIVVGIPAKIIKYRFTKEQIQELLELKWWNFSINKLKLVVDDFDKIENLDFIEDKVKKYNEKNNFNS